MAPRAEPAMQPQDELCRRLGARFRQYREAAGLGLRPFATKVGLTYPTIRRHEAGNMMLRANVLIECAAVLGVEPGDLLNWDPIQ